MTSSAALLLLFWAGQPALFEAVEPHMGTLVRIQVYATGEAQAKAAFQAGFARIAALDNALSDYKPDSEVNRLPATVSPDLFRVLEHAQALAAETDGAFDVTTGRITRLWRQARKAGKPPAADAVAEAVRHSGWRKLRLDPATRGVTLDDPEIQLDLGGIAKGFAADEALAAITAKGVRSALVAVSGDLAFSAPPPGRKGWRIDAGGSIAELSHATISTSGAAEQHLGPYSHIVDPRTGMGITDPITVTVIAPRGIEADSLATAISVLGRERGTPLAARHRGVSATIR